MSEFWKTSLFWGCCLALAAYFLGDFLKRKTKQAWLNPLLFAIVLCILFLGVFRVEYEDFAASCRPLSYLLTPATVCLAVPLYRQIRVLQRYPKAILAGIAGGVAVNFAGILLLALVFSLDRSQVMTLLPKSITTAIGMGLSEELGGIASLTVALIILTGLTGNLSAALVCRLFRVEDPVAKGVAIGTASHAIGTAKALEMGEVEGAVSSLSLALTGLLTVAAAILTGALIP